MTRRRFPRARGRARGPKQPPAMFAAAVVQGSPESKRSSQPTAPLRWRACGCVYAGPRTIRRKRRRFWASCGASRSAASRWRRGRPRRRGGSGGLSRSSRRGRQRKHTRRPPCTAAPRRGGRGAALMRRRWGRCAACALRARHMRGDPNCPAASDSPQLEGRSSAFMTTPPATPCILCPHDNTYPSHNTKLQNNRDLPLGHQPRCIMRPVAIASDPSIGVQGCVRAARGAAAGRRGRAGGGGGRARVARGGGGAAAGVWGRAAGGT
jgi:hypothetical protein